MPNPSVPRAIDYLIIGHLARDGAGVASRLGGTAAYAGVTAAAMGRRVGLVTSTASDLDLEPLSDIDLANSPAPHPTSFENHYERGRRRQRLNSLANPLGFEDIPAEWQRSPLVHLAPIAGEVDPSLARQFPKSFVGITAQGWLREWDHEGVIYASSFESIEDVLRSADAVVVSIEDLAGDQHAAEAMATHCRLLAVTEGAQGVTVYREDEVRHVPAPTAHEADPTGAGDVFAAAFFIHLTLKGDPWLSAEFANRMASASVAVEGVAPIRGIVANLERQSQAVE
jgi:sugar/nucleoside kinase (ribokinase family)